jgi:hypothetical protein
MFERFWKNGFTEREKETSVVMGLRRETLLMIFPNI